MTYSEDQTPETGAPTSKNTGAPRAGLSSKYVRWGGLAAVFGPLLVLVANVYILWALLTYGSIEGVLSEGLATTTPFLVFGGIRLLGAMLLVFGLIALYARQVEAAGTLGLIGFLGSMIGTVLLTGVAWFQTFGMPVLAAEVPGFFVAQQTGDVGVLLSIGQNVPIYVQAIGWVIFGIATYRARVFPRRATIVLVVGALLLFVPIPGIPVVFQLAVAWLGFLLFTGRVEPASRKGLTGPSGSESVGS